MSSETNLTIMGKIDLSMTDTFMAGARVWRWKGQPEKSGLGHGNTLTEIAKQVVMR